MVHCRVTICVDIIQSLPRSLVGWREKCWPRPHKGTVLRRCTPLDLWPAPGSQAEVECCTPRTKPWEAKVLWGKFKLRQTLLIPLGKFVLCFWQLRQSVRSSEQPRCTAQGPICGCRARFMVRITWLELYMELLLSLKDLCAHYQMHACVILWVCVKHVRIWLHAHTHTHTF